MQHDEEGGVSRCRDYSKSCRATGMAIMTPLMMRAMDFFLTPVPPLPQGERNAVLSLCEFRSNRGNELIFSEAVHPRVTGKADAVHPSGYTHPPRWVALIDRKSTRLNSSH